MEALRFCFVFLGTCGGLLGQLLVAIGDGGAAPFTAGLVEPAMAARLRSGVLLDGAAVAGRVEVHRDSRGAYLAGILFAGPRRRELRIRAEAPPPGDGFCQAEGGAFRVVDGGDAPLEARADGTIDSRLFHARLDGLVPAAGGWRSDLQSRLHGVAQFEARLQGIPLSLELRVYRGLPRLDLAASLYAPGAARLHDGLLLDLPETAWSVLRLGGSAPRERGSEPFSIPWPGGADLLLDLEGGERLAISHPEACEGPDRVSWDPAEARLRVRLLPPGQFLDRGEARLLRLTFQFGEPGAQMPLVYSPRALPGIAGHPNLARPASPVPGSIEFKLAEAVERFLGDPQAGYIRSGEGAGDYRFSPGEVGNLEYDTVLGLLLHALRSGDFKSFQAARASADHLLAYDRDGAGSGLFFSHGHGHRSGPIEAGHHWVEGLLLLDRASRDGPRRRLLDEILDVQASTLGALDLQGERPRSLGWGLLALSCQAESGVRVAEARTSLRKFRRHLVASQTRRGWLRLTGPPDREEGEFEASPYVQGGIIAPALARSLGVDPDDRGARALSRLVSALLEDGVAREEGRVWMPARVRLARRDGKFVGAAGRAPCEHAALFLSGLALAAPPARESGPWRELRSTLGRNLRMDRKTLIGPELSILLRAVPGLGP